MTLHKICQVQCKTQKHISHRLVFKHKLLVVTQTCLPCAAAQSTGPASLIWIRNQMLLVLCEILESNSL